MTRLPRDLTADQHVCEALQLEHPFNLDARLEADVRFAVDGCARLGPCATAWRNGVLSKSAHWLQPSITLTHGP